MVALQVYAWCHAALAAGTMATAVWHLRRGDGLAAFGTDMLYLLLAFMLLGGGLVLAAG
jgi:hypothetical protein